MRTSTPTGKASRHGTPQCSNACQCRPRGGRLPCLRPLAKRHADGVRRGPAGRGDDARRGAAGRPGGSRGAPVRRSRGRVLDDALAAAGIERDGVYVTNAVKHFKWRPSGKRRIHDKPNRAEVAACRPWLDAELAAVRPRVLVLLGATAAQALLGTQFRVTRERGKPIDGTEFAEHVLATVHPSSIVRIRDATERAEAERGLAADLRTAADLLGR